MNLQSATYGIESSDADVLGRISDDFSTSAGWVPGTLPYVMAPLSQQAGMFPDYRFGGMPMPADELCFGPGSGIPQHNSTGTNSSPTPTSTTPSAFYPPLMGTMGDSGETTPTRTIAPLQTNFDYRDLHPDIGTAYVTSEPPSSISSHTNPSSLSSPSVSNDHHMRKHSRSEEDQKPSTSTTGLTRRRKSSPKDADSVRAVYLEKNRLAASKCRNRQKKQEEKLVEKGRAVERINKGLKSEVDFLKESMRYLMEDVSRHQTCSDNRLATYVQRRADRLAIGDVPTTVKREEEEDGLNSDPNMKAVEEEDGEE